MTHRTHTSRLSEAPGLRRASHRPVRNCPPHTWDCPVLTKRDPLAVAWTCAGCGAIVTTAVGAPRPAGDEGSVA
ncbi:MAG: hypothetical protein ACYDHH_29530 [Solirubrobacteraceae bacterium]